MKKSLKSTLALALSLGIVFSSAACKKKAGNGGDSNSGGSGNAAESKDGGSSGSGGSSSDAKKSVSGRVIKESDPYFNVSAEQLKVDVPEGKKLYYYQITSHKIVGDRILANMFIQYEIPKDIQKKLDSLNLYDEKQSEEYTRITEEYCCNKMQLFDLQGNPLTTVNLETNAELSGAFPLPNGEILVFSSVYNWNDCSSVPKLFVLSSTGEKVRDITLSIKDPLYSSSMHVTESGNIMLSCIGKIYLLDKEGKLISEEKNEQLNGGMICSGGTWYAMLPRLTSDGEEMYIQEYDAESGKLKGQPIKTDRSLYNLTQGDKDCFTLDSNGINKYDPIKMEETQILSWNDTDINSASLTLEGARIISENEMFFFQEKAPDMEGRSDMDKKGGEVREVFVVDLKKADKNPHAGKTILTLGTNGYTNEDFLDHLLEYNLDPAKPVRLELYDYFGDKDAFIFSPEDYENGQYQSIEKLNLDILSGKGPDILVGYSQASQFFNDDILLDLNTYLNSDSTIHREEYFDNIFRAFEDNGKLYAIPLTFSIEGLALNNKLTGGKSSLTFSDLDSIASSLPQNTQLLSSNSCESLLKDWLPHLMSHFIDHQNQKVDFESDEFKALLEAVKKYGKLNSQGNSNAAMDGGFLINDDILFMEGTVAACSTTLYSLDSYALALYLAKRDGVTLAGIPSSSGIGLSANGDLTMSISASSGNPDLAWEFIKDFLEEDVQTRFSFYSGHFPVNRNAFAANCETEMEVSEDYYKQLQEEAKTNPDMAGDLNNFLHLTKEKADELKKIIEGITQIECYDSDILNIILEEAPAFFLDQRSVEDVCKNIQNRASIVIQER